jgi:uncharacterized protein (TIGR02117 family)
MDKRPSSNVVLRAWRWLVSAVIRGIAGFVLLYAGFLALGCVPVNLNHKPPARAESITIYVRSNEIHSDLVLPVGMGSTGRNWHQIFPPSDFRHDVSDDEFVAIGWGNREFFVDTPTWQEFRLATALRGLFTPSESILHVEYVPVPMAETYHPIRISSREYQRLCDFIDETIAKEGDTAVTATTKTHGASDRFYRSRGSYHLFNTCNQWTGRGLKRAGVRTGLWTPLQQQVRYWLPTEPSDDEGITF